MNKNLKPFDCEYSPQFANLLDKLGISLAISTYQAGKVVVLSSVDKDHLIQLPRSFESPMGMAIKDDKLAVATKNEVVVLKNSTNLAQTYPQNPNTYDGLYVPRAKYYTGYVSMHDMEFIGNNKLVGINTLFSCLCEIDEEFSFTPVWKPPFISELAPEDRCHLNGIATENGEIKYITALGQTDKAQAWRTNKMKGGIVMEYPSGKIIADGLGMPHSPRIYNSKLYVLNSTQGELITIDRVTGKKEVICQLGGFARGMCLYGDYLFIGVSKLRHNSPVFSDLPIAKSSFAGVVAVYLPYKSIVGSFKYKMSVDEIYDVKVLAKLKRPSILSTSSEIHKLALSIPGTSLWAASEETKQDKAAIQKNISQQNKAAYRFQLVKNTSVENLLSQFSGLLFPFFIPFLQKMSGRNKLIPIVCLYNEKAVALAVVEIRKNNAAELLSIFVSPEHRKKGIATKLLEVQENLLRKNNIQYIDITFKDKWENLPIIEKLLSKANYLAPKRTVLHVERNNSTIMQSAWVKEALKMEDEITITDWVNVTEQQKMEIREMEGKTNGYPAYLSPFQLPEILNTKASKVASLNNKIVGWSIYHNIASDKCQCSALFINAENRKNKLSQRLLANSYRELDKQNINTVSYQVKYEDKLVRTFFASLISDKNIIKSKYHTIASRKIL